MMLMILVMMKSEVVMVKKKWQSAKFGGNDGGFHLEANMSAAPQPRIEKHGESWLILIIQVDGWAKAMMKISQNISEKTQQT